MILTQMILTQIKAHPLIIFGPAGTGKTRTLVEIVRVLLTYSTAQILIAAPSNAAADVLAQRIHKVIDDDKVICRWNALRRLDASVSSTIQLLSNDQRVKTARVVVSTCLSAATLPQRRFDFCLIDEAGQGRDTFYRIF